MAFLIAFVVVDSLGIDIGVETTAENENSQSTCVHTSLTEPLDLLGRLLRR